MQILCIYCLQVGRRFGFVCRWYKSAIRDLRSNQIYYNSQRKLYETHCCLFHGKLLTF